MKSAGCKDIGLLIEANHWEYPFWVLLKPKNEKDIRLEHVALKSGDYFATHIYPLGEFDPCAVVTNSYKKVSR